LTDATLTISSLTGSGGAIDSSGIDLRVVKNWWQASAGQRRRYYPPVYTPELLLSDDRFDFGSQVWSKDNLPSLPKLGHAVTDIDAYTSKQFAVEVKVAAGATPGIYSGAVTLSATGVANRTLDVELEVLDISLDEPDKDFILYHRANYHNTSDLDYMDEFRYEQQVHDIREHSMNRIHLRATDTSYIDKVASEGFSEFSISQVSDVSKLDAMLGYGMEPFFYGIDEPNGLDDIRAQIDLSKMIHSLCSGQDCGKVITAITKEWADRLWDPNDPIYESGEYEPLDYANLTLEASEEYLDARRRGERDGTALKEYRQAYYWQIRREDPRVNRYYAGIHLWLTDLDGIYPYVYQSIREDPYDDFDFEDGSPYYAANRDGHVSYPSQQGPVCTIEWEALREGINDYRYLQTWDRLREQVTLIDPIDAARSAAVVDAALEKYRAADTLDVVDIAAYDADRRLIETEILALTVALDVTIDVANGEQSIASTLGVGSYVDTHWSDSISERIDEALGGGGSGSGGGSAESQFEHHWFFEVAGTDPVVFQMLAQIVSSNSDAFEISYSIDAGLSWSAALFTVDSPTPTAYTAALPAGTSGALIIRAKNANRERDESNASGLVIDHMYLRSTTVETDPVPEPHLLLLQAVGGLVVVGLAHRRRFRRAFVR